MYQFKFVFIFLISIFISACNFNFGSYETVTIILPEWDFSDFHLYKWKVEIQSININETYFIPPEKNAFTVTTQKNQPLSVTANPITSHINSESELTLFFKPAGAIYPYSNINNNLFLSWDEGFPAFLMQQLFKSNNSNSEISKYIHSFNWIKLKETICKKIQDSVTMMEDASYKSTSPYYYNPWLLDYNLILDNICSNKFSSTNLNLKKTISIDINSINTIYNYDLYSSFIPENLIIDKFKCITINTLNSNFFAIDNLCLIIKYPSSKKLSSQIVFMPILIDDL